jgi:hypothetical protein
MNLSKQIARVLLPSAVYDVYQFFLTHNCPSCLNYRNSRKVKKLVACFHECREPEDRRMNLLNNRKLSFECHWKVRDTKVIRRLCFLFPKIQNQVAFSRENYKKYQNIFPSEKEQLHKSSRPKACPIYRGFSAL